MVNTILMQYLKKVRITAKESMMNSGALIWLTRQHTHRFQGLGTSRLGGIIQPTTGTEMREILRRTVRGGGGRRVAGARPPHPLTGSTCPPVESYSCLGCWLSFGWRSVGSFVLPKKTRHWSSLAVLLWEIKAGACLEMLHLDKMLGKCSITAIWRDD